MNRKQYLMIAFLLITFPILLQFTIKRPPDNYNIHVIDIITGFCIGLGINIILSFFLKQQ